MSKQNLSEQKAVASPADLFARKGSAKPAGQLISYERRAGAAKDAEDAAESGAQSQTLEIIGGAGSLLTVIEFRKPAPGSTAEAKPESKSQSGAEGKSIAELSKAVSEALAGLPDEDADADGKSASEASKTPPAAGDGSSAEAKPAAVPPKPDMAPFSKTAKATPATRLKVEAKPARAPTPGGAKAPPAAKPAPATKAAPKAPSSPLSPLKAPPLTTRPPRQESRSGLPLGLLVLAGLMLAGWLAVTNLGFAPSDGETTPAPGPESATPEPSTESAAPEATDDPAPESDGSATGEAASETVEPSFDLIRIEPDGEAVIAGRASPNAELILLDNGEPIGRVTADWAGQWAFIPEGPLRRGDHQFSLVVAEPQGTVTLPAPEAQESVAPADEEPSEDDGAAAPAGEAAPEGDLGEQSWLSAPEVAPAPLPGHKPDLDVAAGDRAVKASYFVQLSSVISLNGAQQERDKLQRVFPELLGDMELAVEQAKLDDWGTRYRVRAGLFAEAAPARALCQELRARSQDCLVIKQ